MKSRINQILESCRDFIADHDPNETPILTAYVNVDPTDPDNRRERPAWLIELKNEAKRLEGDLDQEELKRRGVQNQWADTEKMVMSRLEKRRSTGRSIAMFTDHRDFLDVDLPLPMPTRLYYGFPQIKHLLFNLDQYKKYLVVLLSGSEVRVLEVFLTRTTDEVRVDTGLELMKRLGRSGHTHKHESRGDEYDRRFTKKIAVDINGYFMGDPDFERLILGGNAKQAHAVKNGLHPAVRNVLVSIESIDFKLPDNEIAQHVKEVADRHELEHDLAVVEDLVARAGRGGTGVLERQGVERALEQQNVRTLVLPYPIEADEFDSLIVDATVGGAEIEFVYDAAADKLAKYGGIGAMMYYPEG